MSIAHVPTITYRRAVMTRFDLTNPQSASETNVAQMMASTPSVLESIRSGLSAA